MLGEATEVCGGGFAQGYGASETGGGVVALTPDDHRADGGRLLPAAGTAMPGVEIGIVDEQNHPLGTDAVGEIVVRSDCVMRSEEHTSELQSLMRSSYAVFCLTKKNK